LESLSEKKNEGRFSIALEIMENDICRCGHYRDDHDNRKTVSENRKFICWMCASKLPFDDNNYTNLDSYHEFRFGTLEYLQRLYESKQRLK